MKKVSIAVFMCLILMYYVSVSAEQKPPQQILHLANTSLVKLGVDPVIVKAVKTENAKGKTLQEIQEMDNKWRATPGIADFMQTLMESECGQYLHRLQQTTPYYAEIFVMDNQGANVCMTNKTSDYWQGDEDKFLQTYKGSTGAVHIGDIEFDDSAQSNLIQVTVPVQDGDRAIGAMTIGIDIDKMVQ
jgi:hypothetical protein